MCRPPTYQAHSVCRPRRRRAATIVAAGALILSASIALTPAAYETDWGIAAITSALASNCLLPIASSLLPTPYSQRR